MAILVSLYIIAARFRLGTAQLFISQDIQMYRSTRVKLARRDYGAADNIISEHRSSDIT